MFLVIFITGLVLLFPAFGGEEGLSWPRGTVAHAPPHTHTFPPLPFDQTRAPTERAPRPASRRGGGTRAPRHAKKADDEKSRRLPVILGSCSDEAPLLSVRAPLVPRPLKVRALRWCCGAWQGKSICQPRGGGGGRACVRGRRRRRRRGRAVPRARVYWAVACWRGRACAVGAPGRRRRGGGRLEGHAGGSRRGGGRRCGVELPRGEGREGPNKKHPAGSAGRRPARAACEHAPARPPTIRRSWTYLRVTCAGAGGRSARGGRTCAVRRARRLGC